LFEARLGVRVAEKLPSVKANNIVLLPETEILKILYFVEDPMSRARRARQGGSGLLFHGQRERVERDSEIENQYQSMGKKREQGFCLLSRRCDYNVTSTAIISSTNNTANPMIIKALIDVDIELLSHAHAARAQLCNCACENFAVGFFFHCHARDVLLDAGKYLVRVRQHAHPL